MSGRVVVLAALLLTGVGAAGRTPKQIGPAVQSQRGHIIFSCRLGGGKIATVTGAGGRFVYRYGTARQSELTIVGTAANGALFKRADVHGGDPDIQLRFVRGAYSYIVHSFPRNEIVDNVPLSGLIVFRAGRRILDRDCSPWAKLSLEESDDLEEVPDIPEGAPSAWGD
jgi:hypothetical protein